MSPTPYYGKIVLVTRYEGDTLDFVIQDSRLARSAAWGDRNQILDFSPSAVTAVVGSVGMAYLERSWLITNGVPFSPTNDPKLPPGLNQPPAGTIVQAQVLEVIPVVHLEFPTEQEAALAGASHGRIGPIALPPGAHVDPSQSGPIPATLGHQFSHARIDDSWLRERGLTWRARGRKRKVSGMVIGIDVRLAIQSGPYAGEEVVVNPYDHLTVAPSPSVNPGSETKIELTEVGAQGDVSFAATFLDG